MGRLRRSLYVGRMMEYLLPEDADCFFEGAIAGELCAGLYCWRGAQLAEMKTRRWKNLPLFEKADARLKGKMKGACGSWVRWAFAVE